MPETIVESAHAISNIDLIYSLSISLVLASMIVVVYRFTHRGFHFERSFLTTLLLISPTVAVVMLLIGSNLALSLGMVGALSIIRFRTVIKDSRDMIYLFLAISVGLGCGTYNWQVAAMATGFLCAVLMLLNLMRFGRPLHGDYVLVLAGESSSPPEQALRTAILPQVGFMETRSINIEAGRWEIVFEIRVPKGTVFPGPGLHEKLVADLGVQRVSLLAPQLSLPV